MPPVPTPGIAGIAGSAPVREIHSLSPSSFSCHRKNRRQAFFGHPRAFGYILLDRKLEFSYLYLIVSAFDNKVSIFPISIFTTHDGCLVTQC